MVSMKKKGETITQAPIYLENSYGNERYHMPQ